MNIKYGPSKGKKIAFVITTLAVAVIYFVTGIGNMLPFQHIAQDMARLGYPPYFRQILGVWKILAAMVIAIPTIPKRIREWAFAGMIFDLTGAAFSRFSAGEPLQKILIPLCITVLVTVNYLLWNSLYRK